MSQRSLTAYVHAVNQLEGVGVLQLKDAAALAATRSVALLTEHDTAITAVERCCAELDAITRELHRRLVQCETLLCDY